MVVNSPVVDPLAQRVGIENTAQQDDRQLGWVPILDRVAGGNASFNRVLLRRLGCNFCVSNNREHGGKRRKAAEGIRAGYGGGHQKFAGSALE